MFYIHATCLGFPASGEWKESSCSSGGWISKAVFWESEWQTSWIWATSAWSRWLLHYLSRCRHAWLVSMEAKLLDLPLHL